jgi:hypothetical protein
MHLGSSKAFFRASQMHAHSPWLAFNIGTSTLANKIIIVHVRGYHEILL